jgi:hypothetical protein
MTAAANETGEHTPHVRLGVPQQYRKLRWVWPSRRHPAPFAA